MVQDGQTSINIPQLIAVAVVGFFAIRWFMSKPGSPASSSSSAASASSASSRRQTAIDLNKIEQVASVFPQLDRRSIAWDLQRNGGNVEATTERVLGGRGLDTPPPTFQPNLPSPATAAGASSAPSSASAGSKKGGAAGGPDLITRYGLQSRVSGKGKEPVPSEEQKRNAWSADKSTRAEALRRRREEMILAARRKMQEKDTQA